MRFIMRLIRWFRGLFCSHEDTFSLRVEVIGFGHRIGDRVYHKCKSCGKMDITEEGIEI